MTWQYFYGREEEIQELCDRIEHMPLTVLFGTSGLGKTSVLRAGLMLELEGSGYLPVYVRFDFADSTRSLEDQVIYELFNALAGTPHRRFAESFRSGAANRSARVTLWNLFHSPELGFVRQDGKMLARPVLILDQFEEVFKSAGAQRAEAFRVVLAELVENRLPADVRRRLDEDQSLVTRLVLPGQPCKVLLSLREDHLHELERWRPGMPALSENRYELRSLNGPKALRAVFEPGCKREDSPPIVEKDVAERIVRYVADVSADIEFKEIFEVSPALLSLMCRQMNERRKQEQKVHLDEEYLSTQKSEDILGEFYENSFQGKPPALRKFVEDELLSGGGNSRIPVLLRAIFEDLTRKGVPEYETKKAIDDLVDNRLLVYRELNDHTFVELTHDILIGVAKVSREIRRERETKEKAARDIAKAQKKSEEEETKRKLAEEQRRIAEENRVKAEEANKQAVRSRNHAYVLMSISGAVSLLWLITAVFTGYMYWQMLLRNKQIAEDNTRLANECLLQADWQPAQWRKGIRYLARALAMEPSNKADAERFFHELMIHRVNAERLPLVTFPKDAVAHAVFSPDSQYFVTFAEKGETAAVRRIGTPGNVLKYLTHASTIVQVAFSPKKDNILTASSDGTVNIWKVGDFNQIANYHHLCPLLQANYNRDGSKILILDANQNVYILDTSTRSHRQLPGANVTQASFSPNGDQILTVSRDSVDVWDADTLRHQAGPFIPPNPVLRAIFTPRGDELLALCSDKIVYGWNVQKGTPLQLKLPCTSAISDAVPLQNGYQILLTTDSDKVILYGTPDDAGSLAYVGRFTHQGPAPPIFSYENGLIITASSDGDANIWNPLLGELQASLKHGNTISEINCSPDGKYVLTTGDDQVAMLWNITLSSLSVSVQKTNGVSDSIFSPDDKFFVAAGVDNTATVWNATSGEWVGTITPTSPAESRSSISKIMWCGDRIITVHKTTNSNRGTYSSVYSVNFWDGGSLRQVGKTLMPPGEVYDVTPDDKGEHALIAGAFDSVMLVDLHSANLLKQLPQVGGVWNAKFSEDGREVLTVCRNGTARLWDIGSAIPTIEKTFQAPDTGKPDEQIAQAIFLPEKFGYRILTVSKNGTAFFQDTESVDSQPFDMTRGISQLILDPKHNQILSVGAANRAELRNASSLNSLRQAGNMLEDEHVQKAFFSRDGEYILTCDTDKTVKVFDARSRQLVAVFTESAQVVAAAFNGAGTRVLIGAKDRVELQDLATPREMFRQLTGLESVPRIGTIKLPGVSALFGGHDNLLADEVQLLAKIVTGAALSDTGTAESVGDRRQLAQSLQAEAKSKMANSEFFEWLFCDDDRITIFPGIKITPSEWVKNSAVNSPDSKRGPDDPTSKGNPATLVHQ